MDSDGRTLERVQELTDALQALEDGPAKEIAEELVGAIVDLYGEGLTRIMQALPQHSALGEEIRERLANDGVVASLLLIHDLYPVPLETRVLEALASVRPYMESHGGNVELTGIVDGVAQLRLEGHCHGCPASLSTLELAIKDALEQAAPDLLGVEVDGLVQPEAVRQARPRPRWLSLDAADEVEPGALRTVTARGVELLVANVAGTLLAYRSDCPVCESGARRCLARGRAPDVRALQAPVRSRPGRPGGRIGRRVSRAGAPAADEGPRGDRGAGDVTAPTRPPPASSPAVVAGLRAAGAHAPRGGARTG